MVYGILPWGKVPQSDGVGVGVTVCVCYSLCPCVPELKTERNGRSITGLECGIDRPVTLLCFDLPFSESGSDVTWLKGTVPLCKHGA